MKDVLELCGYFDLPAKPVSFKECRVGHINSTYFIDCEDGSRYVLQRINTAVFRNPEGLMRNVFGVTGHIRKKLIASGADPSRGTLSFVKLKDGRLYYPATDGSAWRVYRYIDGVVSLQSAESPDLFAAVGRAFGVFQRQLADYDASELVETIPHFHDTPSRLADLRASVSADPVGRAALVSDEIAFCESYSKVCGYITEGIASGRFPLRVTHNDTKLNNILLDEKTLEPVCVIDLDTIMPGSVLYDFGDSIRFGASTAAEDCDDYKSVKLNDEMFYAFSKGFVSGLDGALTRDEILGFPMGALIITLETGIRFLKDYIDGDVYFRVEKKNHNLIRARNQFALVKDIESKLGKLDGFVKDLVSAT